ncbi:MAG: LuxR family transcriptional regulator [Formivibrio sp.]|nr:LuxR family transcriptional regulator [Formivibrio sp.]
MDMDKEMADFAKVGQVMRCNNYEAVQYSFQATCYSAHQEPKKRGANMPSSLHTGETDLIAEISWNLSENRGRADSRASVLPLVAKLVNAEYAASFVWDEQAKRSVNRVAHNISEQALDSYDNYYCDMDLVTPVMRGAAAAANVDRFISRKNLTHSDFFDGFLRPSGMHYGINIFFFDQGRDIGDLRIWRGADGKPFSTREERLLDVLSPYFQRSLRVCKGTHGPLSPRETEVVRWVAQGSSDKEIARTLGVAFTTVRTHITSAMNKLGCRNRTQLAQRLP